MNMFTLKLINSSLGAVINNEVSSKQILMVREDEPLPCWPTEVPLYPITLIRPS